MFYRKITQKVHHLVRKLSCRTPNPSFRKHILSSGLWENPQPEPRAEGNIQTWCMHALILHFFVTVFQSLAIQWMSRAMTRVEKTAYFTGRLNPVLQLFFLLDKPLHSKHGCRANMAAEHVQHKTLHVRTGRAGAGWRRRTRSLKWIWMSHNHTVGGWTSSSRLRPSRLLSSHP